MATYPVSRSALDKTLSGTTADTVNIDADDAGGAERFAVVYNHASNTATMYARTDGTTAVASADGCTPIFPGMFEVFEVGQFGDKTLSIVGNGNVYSVVGTNAG